MSVVIHCLQEQYDSICRLPFQHNRWRPLLGSRGPHQPGRHRSSDPRSRSGWCWCCPWGDRPLLSSCEGKKQSVVGDTVIQGKENCQIKGLNKAQDGPSPRQYCLPVGWGKKDWSDIIKQDIHVEYIIEQDIHVEYIIKHILFYICSGALLQHFKKDN